MSDVCAVVVSTAACPADPMLGDDCTAACGCGDDLYTSLTCIEPVGVCGAPLAPGPQRRNCCSAHSWCECIIQLCVLILCIQ